MNVYKTEDEQVEQLKRWIKAYSLPVIIGILIACIALYGFRYWQSTKMHAAEQAADLYELLLNNVATQQFSAANTPIHTLITEHSGTPYADFATLMQANLAIQKQDNSSARTALQSVIDQSSNDTFKTLAAIRLARLTIAEHHPAEALTLLSALAPVGFDSLIEMARGDAYMAMNNTKAAKTAYLAALSASPNNALIQLKLDHLQE